MLTKKNVCVKNYVQKFVVSMLKSGLAAIWSLLLSPLLVALDPQLQKYDDNENEEGK